MDGCFVKLNNINKIPVKPPLQLNLPNVQIPMYQVQQETFFPLIPIDLNISPKFVTDTVQLPIFSKDEDLKISEEKTIVASKPAQKSIYMSDDELDEILRRVDKIINHLNKDVKMEFHKTDKITTNVDKGIVHSNDRHYLHKYVAPNSDNILGFRDIRQIEERPVDRELEEISNINRTRDNIRNKVSDKTGIDYIKYENAVNYLLKKINAANYTLAEKLFGNIAYSELGYALTEIKDIFLSLNETNMPVAHTIFNNKADYGREDLSNIDSILASTNKKNIDIVNLLCTRIKEKGSLFYLKNILFKLKPENNDFIIKLCKNEENKKLRNIFNVIVAAENAENGNKSFIEALSENPKFMNSEVAEALPAFMDYIDEENMDVAKCIFENIDTIEEGGYDDCIRISHILELANRENADYIKRIIKNKKTPPFYLPKVIELACEFGDYSKDIYEEMLNYKDKMLKNPELYISGEHDNPKDTIERFFYMNNCYSIIKAFAIFDKESVDNLFRRRLYDAKIYIQALENYSNYKLKLLKEMVSCNNMSNKPLLPAQKVECMDIINAFSKYDIQLDIIQNAIADKKIDLGNLKMLLFKEVLLKCGISEEQLQNIPSEKLMAWDIEYMHHIPQSISKDEKAFSDLLNAANSEDFIGYIHDKNNDYGKANKNTKAEFNLSKMNYSKWIESDKNLETTFVSIDKNTEFLVQMANSILEDVSVLRGTPVKSFFDKQFPKYIDEKGIFRIPQEVITSKANLTELISNIIEQLKPVWDRALKNKDNLEKQEKAEKTLTVLSHLKTKLQSLEKMQEIRSEKNLNLTIKMWDRNPQKDLFQGNFSTCCIGMGEANAHAMPHYLMNTAFNMIEIVDNNTGKTIGNALCYFVQDKKGTPIFVVDNIEINNSQKPSDKTGIELRKKIFEYAEKVAKSVTGEKTDVIMSGDYNDVVLKGLKQEKGKLKLIGNIDCQRIYMDLFDGWTDDWDEFCEATYYKDSDIK